MLLIFQIHTPNIQQTVFLCFFIVKIQIVLQKLVENLIIYDKK